VEARVLFHGDGLAAAQLRFASNSHIDPHTAPFVIEVVCLEGSGFTTIGDSESPLRAGERVTWPPGVVHGLRTEEMTMVTLMLERHDRVA